MCSLEFQDIVALWQSRLRHNREEFKGCLAWHVATEISKKKQEVKVHAYGKMWFQNGVPVKTKGSQTADRHRSPGCASFSRKMIQMADILTRPTFQSVFKCSVQPDQQSYADPLTKVPFFSLSGGSKVKNHICETFSLMAFKGEKKNGTDSNCCYVISYQFLICLHICFLYLQLSVFTVVTLFFLA